MTLYDHVDALMCSGVGTMTVRDLDARLARDGLTHADLLAELDRWGACLTDDRGLVTVTIGGDESTWRRFVARASPPAIEVALRGVEALLVAQQAQAVRGALDNLFAGLR